MIIKNKLVLVLGLASIANFTQPWSPIEIRNDKGYLLPYYRVTALPEDSSFGSAGNTIIGVLAWNYEELFHRFVIDRYVPDRKLEIQIPLTKKTIPISSHFIADIALKAGLTAIHLRAVAGKGHFSSKELAARTCIRYGVDLVTGWIKPKMVDTLRKISPVKDALNSPAFGYAVPRFISYGIWRTLMSGAEKGEKHFLGNPHHSCKSSQTPGCC